MIINSYAKINLYLKVLRRRSDTYHDIITLFERISLCDRLSLTLLSTPKIEVVSGNKDLPCDHTNLAYKSAQLLQHEYGVTRGVRIAIQKRIPIGAGLGGGSSNAASVLEGLNRLWKLQLSRRILVRHAMQIGSDVAFFMYDTPFAQGSGRGEIIKPFPSLARTLVWHVVVVPRIPISTPLIYKKWDESSHGRGSLAGLTKAKLGVKLLLSALRDKDRAAVSRCLVNDLEPVAMAAYPVVREAKKTLIQQGVRTVRMSGSGSSVFGIVATRKDAEKIRTRLKATGVPWQTYIACTV